MPEITRRSSTRGLPGKPLGRCGSIASQASSDSQNRCAMIPLLQRNPIEQENSTEKQQDVWVPYLGRGLIQVAVVMTVV